MTQIFLSLKKDIEVIEVDEKQATLKMPLFELPLYWSAGGRAVLRDLAANGITDEKMKSTIIEHDGPMGLMKFMGEYSRLINMGVICHTLEVDDQTLVTLMPLTGYHRGFSGTVEVEKKYTLSRFAFLHTENGQLALECPLGYARILLHDPSMAAVIATLATPHSYRDLAGIFPAIPEDAFARFFKLLLGGKMLSDLSESGAIQEEENPVLQQWDFHDLLFHTRTRYGRYDKTFAGDFRFMGKIELPPAVKPPMSEDIIALPTPDLDQLKQHDPSFATVMETRRSVYEFGEKPITLDQVGEFMFRVARVKQTFGEHLMNNAGYSEPIEYTKRPYPGGGGLYELEFYLIVNECEGIPAALYHYHPVEHHLEKIKDITPQLTALLNDAERAMMHGQKPNILISLAARFQRLAWKYNTLAYALIQKNVGVLYQTMYLNATAMGLAPCGLGAGNADLFADAAGLDYLVEGSVGDFALSSRK